MTDESERPTADQKAEVYLKWIAQDMKIVRQQTTEMISYLRDAEKEVSEKMRRFIMYFHDIHDIVNLYHELGHQHPRYIAEELQRCDDRFRQLLEEAHEAGGTFEKVRRDMSHDPENRWDHTHQIEHKKDIR